MRHIFVVAICLLISTLLSATAHAEKKAFIIGIDNYKHANKLENSKYTAKEIDKVLSGYDFKTKFVSDDSDHTHTRIKSIWTAWVNTVQKGDEVLIFISSHGISLNGRNYLLPSEYKHSDLDRRDLDKVFIPLSYFMDTLKVRKPSIAVWVFDACRDNAEITLRRGYIYNQPYPANAMVIYTAGDGEQALDKLSASDKIRGTVYGRVLVPVSKILAQSDIHELVNAVQRQVFKLRPNIHPGYYSAIYEPWCLQECGSQAIALNELSKELSASSPAAVLTSQRIGWPVKISDVGRRAVFLGTKGGAVSCAGQAIELHPFGCEILENVAAGSGEKYLDDHIVAQTTVDIVLDVPAKDEPAVPISSVSDKNTVVVQDIEQVDSSGDTYYWAVIKQ